MNTTRILKYCNGAFIAAMLISAPLATAASPTESHEMKTAFAKAAEGPGQLRRYIERTSPIYALNYNEVMTQFQAAQAASTNGRAQVTEASTRENSKPRR